MLFPHMFEEPRASGHLSTLIADVHMALSQAASPDSIVETPVPAVNPKKSVFPDRLISLEDGRPYRTLKRHLGGLGLTPEAYREKWGLARDYPMTGTVG